MCDKGMSGPTSYMSFEINKNGWSEKYVELERLCLPILKFLQYNTEIASVVEITKDAMKSKLVGKVEKAQTVFDLLTAVTDADKFAEIIFDLLQKCESPEEIKLFLKQRRDNLDEAIDYLKSRGFPIEHKTC